MNPDRSSPVMNYSDATLRELVALLEHSPSEEQCIYREAELDDLIRQVEADLTESGSPTLKNLLQAALEAHGMVAKGRAQDAARRLASAIGS